MSTNDTPPPSGTPANPWDSAKADVADTRPSSAAQTGEPNARRGFFDRVTTPLHTTPAPAMAGGPRPVQGSVSVPPSGSAVTAASNRSFWRRLWRWVVALKDLLALLFLLLFFGIVFAILSARPNAALPFAEGALVLDMKGTISDQPAAVDPTAVLRGAEVLPEYRTRELVHAIRTAATDPAVKTVVMDLDGFLGAGQVTLGEVADAMLTVRKAGKPVLTYATAYSDSAYFLASHASEVWTSPLGGVTLSGPSGQGLFFKDLLDRIGITPNVYRVGTFKSAVEPYIRNDMSPEAKEATQAYVSVLWDEWQTRVRTARPKAQFAPLANDPAATLAAHNNDNARMALDLGLVDKLGERMAFAQRVVELSGGPAEPDRPWKVKAIPYGNWLASHPLPTSGDAIAVVPVVGTIVDGDQPVGVAGGETVASTILDAVADPAVKAIVLRVDSPGGSVTASEEIRQALLQAKARKLPVVASMGNVAASGGFWVSTPADQIIAEPDTITGSIGVFGVIPSAEKLAARYGVNVDGVTSTPLSGQPNIVEGPNAAFNALGQASVESTYRTFVKLVADNRKTSPDKIEPVAEGRVWAGGTARQLNLIDGFGGLDDAVATAAKLAKLDPNAVHQKWFEKQPSPFARWLAGIGGARVEQAALHSGSGRDMFAVAADEQAATLGRAVHQVQTVVGGAGLQAACLDCVGHSGGAARAAPSAGDPMSVSTWQVVRAWLARLVG